MSWQSPSAMSASCVSVVVSTYNRPHLVTCALRSALAQTLNEVEVVVGLDRPDDVTPQALRKMQDERLQIKVLPSNRGAADARNAGVQASHCPWIAILHGDDEWLPSKLELQLEAAQRSTHHYPIISCRFAARGGAGRFIWPRRIPRPAEHISAYLFCRHSPFFGEGVLLPSTLLVSASLAQMTPFSSELRRFQDVDSVLRASAV